MLSVWLIDLWWWRGGGGAVSFKPDVFSSRLLAGLSFTDFNISAEILYLSGALSVGFQVCNSAICGSVSVTGKTVMEVNCDDCGDNGGILLVVLRPEAKDCYGVRGGDGGGGGDIDVLYNQLSYVGHHSDA